MVLHAVFQQELVGQRPALDLDFSFPLFVIVLVGNECGLPLGTRDSGGGFASPSASHGFGSSNLGTIGSPASLSSIGAGTLLHVHVPLYRLRSCLCSQFHSITCSRVVFNRHTYTHTLTRTLAHRTELSRRFSLAYC